MRPQVSIVCLTRWATPASSVTDAPLAIAVPPAALISVTTFSAAAEVAAGAVHRAAQIVDHHLGAAPGEIERMRAPQAAARAGDDGDLAVETDGHAKSP